MTKRTREDRLHAAISKRLRARELPFDIASVHITADGFARVVLEVVLERHPGSIGQDTKPESIAEGMVDSVEHTLREALERGG